tara:strand:- start:42 stop:779 length:738 start_codon:yes stop_codon:yes gene_type:complete
MKKSEIIDKLRDDDYYYGDFGKQYLSNSNIKTLLSNPENLHKPMPSNPNFIIGGYFHTAILEPDKIKKYRIIEASTRNTKVYKEMSGGELCLLQHEVDMLESLVDKMMNNNVCRDLISPTVADVDYEEPQITELFGQMWKGKADIINHEEQLVIDLKTTSDLDKFKWNAKKYNYDSQAYIYRELFGYEMVFIAIDKKTSKIGLFDCSTDFYRSGRDKVEKACEMYELFHENKNFEPQQYFINETL